ncbi:MAG: hypothetical protein KDD38_04900 [Bdellovibrionales bacterium]|nr:hypothetical protein [Bdellovibrionales bacterium]
MKVMWGIIAASLIFAVGAIYLVFKGNVELQPLRVLNPTNFSSPSEIGAVTFRRFWQEVNTEKLVVVASSPYLRDYDSVWNGFLSVAKANHVEFDFVFQQDGLRGLHVAGAQPLNWEEVQLSLIGGKRVLVHVVATDQMWREVLEHTTGGFIIFQSVLPVTESEKNILISSCRAGDKLNFQISCQALKSLSQGKRKKFDPKKIVGVIEKHGRREHILYIHEVPDLMYSM